VYTRARLTWVVLVAPGLLALAVAAGRAALRRDAIPERMREHPAPPPRRPYLIMNPRSGGGKVVRFDLKDKAEALGATVALLEGPGPVDVAALARQAVAEGADLLGVAGGDGTQALVAGIAAEHDVPLLVISAGTRNHFALDLGLDREDPARCLDALHDGVELRVDLGVIGERPFVNNASFGAYAAVVQSPAYRDDKVDIAGLGRRARLDRANLGLFAVTVTSAVQASGLLAGTRSRGLTRLTAPQVVIDADAAQIPVGVDGEALLLATPVRCTVQPAALRVRVPRDRPGVPDPKPIMDWNRLRQLALTLPTRHQTTTPRTEPGGGDHAHALRGASLTSPSASVTRPSMRSWDVGPWARAGTAPVRPLQPPAAGRIGPPPRTPGSRARSGRHSAWRSR
jgi:diacylglycerol kinase family enzyme